MKRIFLVDFTTTSHTFLEDNPKLSPEDEIIIFFGGSYNKLPIAVTDAARGTNAVVKTIYKGTEKKNIAFIISTYAGYMFGKYGNIANYYVVSRTTQLKALIDYADTNTNIQVKYGKTIKKCLERASKEAENEECISN